MSQRQGECTTIRKAVAIYACLHSRFLPPKLTELGIRAEDDIIPVKNVRMELCPCCYISQMKGIATILPERVPD